MALVRPERRLEAQPGQGLRHAVVNLLGDAKALAGDGFRLAPALSFGRDVFDRNDHMAVVSRIKGGVLGVSGGIDSAVCLALAALICTSCMAQEPHVVLNGERYTVEIADTVELQALGLMFREEMADEIEAFKNAAKECKTYREDVGKHVFNETYGSNNKKKNALGKCVSQTVKASEEPAGDS